MKRPFAHAGSVVAVTEMVDGLAPSEALGTGEMLIGWGETYVVTIDVC